MKIFAFYLIHSFLIPAILLSILTFATSTQFITIDCKISKIDYVYFNKLTSCAVKAKPNIVTPDITVSSVLSGSTVGVKVFYAKGQVIRYIPKNLNAVFPDIIGIWLESSQLKLVSKEDLEAFPGLLMFASVDNDIQFLVKDLFIYNPKLQVVSFQGNKITYIEPNVFSPISKSLQQLYLEKQGINCGLSNALTPKEIKADLAKLSSSKCGDILNAPPLYIQWIELKHHLAQTIEKYEDALNTAQSNLEACFVQIENHNASLQMCKNEVYNCESSLSTVSNDYVRCKGNMEALANEYSHYQEKLDSCNTYAQNCTNNLNQYQLTCGQDLEYCQVDLAAANSAVTACMDDLSTCSAALTTSETERYTCEADLASCNNAKTYCEMCRADPAEPSCT